jgi:hypothetical protein
VLELMDFESILRLPTSVRAMDGMASRRAGLADIH